MPEDSEETMYRHKWYYGQSEITVPGKWPATGKASENLHAYADKGAARNDLASADSSTFTVRRQLTSLTQFQTVRDQRV